MPLANGIASRTGAGMAGASTSRPDVPTGFATRCV
jgi:hypothetical protein